MRLPGLVGALAVVVLLSGTGCASAAPEMQTEGPSTMVTTPSLPPDGVYLASFGFTNAPPGFSVPASVKPLHGYNIPELIDVIYDGADGAIVHDYLLAHLGAMGYTITSSSADSIVWENDQWQGAFTMTSQRAGFTLRRQS